MFSGCLPGFGHCKPGCVCVCVCRCDVMVVHGMWGPVGAWCGVRCGATSCCGSVARLLQPSLPNMDIVQAFDRNWEERVHTVLLHSALPCMSLMRHNVHFATPVRTAQKCLPCARAAAIPPQTITCIHRNMTCLHRNMSCLFVIAPQTTSQQCMLRCGRWSSRRGR